MFGTKTKPKTTTSNSILPTNLPSQDSCIIAIGTVIEGKVTTTENLRVDGTIVGEVKCEKRFVMGESGKIEGDVVCMDSDIKGTIQGTIKAKGLLHLLGTAMIKGKIMAKKMVVDEGAAYNGECIIGENKVK